MISIDSVHNVVSFDRRSLTDGMRWRMSADIRTLLLSAHLPTVLLE